MAKTNKKQKPFSGMPYNKYAQIEKARSLTNTSGSEPTVETFSNIQSSNDLVRPSNENQISDLIRPRKKTFNIADYANQILISVFSAIIIGIGAYLILNKVQLSVLEKDVEKHTKSIESIETKQDGISTDINEVKRGTNLINYRLDKIELKLDKQKK